MRLAIISDIHGNFEALQRVLEDIGQAGADRIVCLGDNIGYGPEPEEVVNELRRLEVPCLMGNHEKALTSSAYLKRLNFTAQESMRITRKLLSPANQQYSKALPGFHTEDGVRFVHGCPPDSATVYLYEPSAVRLRKLFDTFPEELCFFGHTHLLVLYGWQADKVETTFMKEGVYRLSPGQRCLVNVGSVGQPRDGTNHAKYLIWDQEKGSLAVRYVSYDIAITANGIIDQGLPEVCAKRLW
jgi:predicted phosphodiesterase